jgi:hypothetical protein
MAINKPVVDPAVAPTLGGAGPDESKLQPKIQYGNNLQPTKMPIDDVKRILMDYNKASNSMFNMNDGTGFATPNQVNIDRVRAFEKNLRKSGYTDAELSKILREMLSESEANRDVSMLIRNK